MKDVSINVEIQGMDRLLRRMHEAGKGEYARDALKSGGERVKAQVSKYPPGSEANDPSRRRFYKRGSGAMYRTASGALHEYGGSKKLGDQWYVKANDLDVVVGNPVPYAWFVHDDKLQAKFHEKRNWKKLKETAKGLSDEILKDISNALIKMWERTK